MQITVHHGREGLRLLRAEWHRLGTGMTRKCFCHLYVWYEACLDALESRPEDVYFFLYRTPDVTAVFPFRRSVRRSRGVEIRVLELPHHPHMNLTDFIVNPAHADSSMLRRIIEHLRTVPGFEWDEIYLPTVIANSAVSRMLQQNPPPRVTQVTRNRATFVDCDVTYEVASSRLSGNFRRNLRRLARRATETGTLEYRSCHTAPELDQAFPQFLEVEAAGWKGDEGTAIGSEPNITRFYRHLMHGATPEARCIINLMTLDGTCIAGQFCLLVDGVLYILKIGYRESHAQMAPGHLLMDQTIHRCCEDPDVRAVSFVLNAEWTRLFRPETRPVHDYYISNCTWRGWVSYLWRAIRARLSPERRHDNPSASALENHHETGSHDRSRN